MIDAKRGCLLVVACAFWASSVSASFTASVDVSAQFVRSPPGVILHDTEQNSTSAQAGVFQQLVVQPVQEPFGTLLVTAYGKTFGGQLSAQLLIVPDFALPAFDHLPGQVTASFTDELHVRSSTLAAGTPVALNWLLFHHELFSGYENSPGQLSFTMNFTTSTGSPYTTPTSGGNTGVSTGGLPASPQFITINTFVGADIDVTETLHLFDTYTPTPGVTLNLDASSTAAAVLQPLPAGVTVTADSGVDYTSMPEPCTPLLLTLLFPVLGRLRRSRARMLSGKCQI